MTAFRHKSILIDVTYTDTQAGVHLRGERADQDGSAASTSGARKRNHSARGGQVSFDERSSMLVTIAVERYRRLGRKGNDKSIRGNRLAMSKKNICKDLILQEISVPFQVAMSRRVRRYSLALRDRQATRGRREEEGMLISMAQGWHMNAK